MFIKTTDLYKINKIAESEFIKSVEEYFTLVENEFMNFWRIDLQQLVIMDFDVDNDMPKFIEFFPTFEFFVENGNKIIINFIFSTNTLQNVRIPEIVIYLKSESNYKIDTNYSEIGFDDFKNEIMKNAYKICYNNKEIDINKITNYYKNKIDMAYTISALGRKGFREVIPVITGKNIMKYF